MHEDLKTFSQKSTQKFHNNFINFEKPQFCLKKKNQKPRSNAWNAWRMKDLGTLLVNKHLI